jgi:hypothetical protein
MWELYFNMLKKVLFVFMFLILFIPSVKALGTLQKKSYLEIKPGQIAEFSTLFWSSDPIEIELKEKTVPENWMVIVEPKKFVLDDNITTSEVISLQDRYVKALPVKILAIPPEDAKPGIYEIIINMVAGKSDRGISFFQEKNFNFRVNVLESSSEQKETIDGSIDKNISKTGKFIIPIKEIEEIPSNYTRIIFWLMIIILTLLVCWVLYKKL